MNEIHITEINIILSIAAAMTSLFISFIAWQRRQSRGAKWFIGLTLAVSWISFWYALEATVGFDVDAYVTFSKYEYIGLTFIPLLWLGFARTYSGSERPFTTPTLILLAIIPLVTVILAFTNEWHHLIWQQPQFDTGTYGPIFAPIYGIGFWIFTLYAYTIFFIGSVLLLRQALHTWHIYRTQAILFLIGTTLPWIGNLLLIFDHLNPIPELYLNTIFLTGGMITFAIGLFRFRLLDIMPLAYETILKHIPDGLIVTDMQQRVLAANPSAHQFMENSQLVPMGTHLQTLCPYITVSVSESSEQIEWRERAVKVKSAPIFDDTSTQQGQLYMLVDLTEQVKNREQLQQSQQQLDAFFTQALDGFFFMMLDEPVQWNDAIDKEATLENIFAQQRVTRANDAILEQYRTTKEQVIGMTPNELFAHDLALGKQVWRQLFDDGHIQFEIDKPRFDGSIMSVEGHYICLYDAQQCLKGHFGIQRDITERKEMELQLRQVTERLKLTLDHLTVVAYELDTDGIFLLSRGKGLEKLNLQPDEVVGQSIFDVYSDFPTLIQAAQKALAGEPQQIEVEVANVIWEANFVPIVDDSGAVDRVFSTAFDITTQREAEAAARRSEAHFRALIEHSHDVIALIDAAGTIRYKSPSIKRVLGYEPEELIGRNAWELAHPDEVESAAGLFETLLTYPDTQLRVEMRYRHKEGDYRWVEATATNAIAEKAVQAIIVNYRDVTERRIVQQALQQERDFYHMVMNSLGQGVTVINANNEFEYVNPAYASFVGLAPEDLIGKTPSDVTAAEDQAELETARTQRLQGETTTYETRLKHANGTDVPVLITGVPRYQNGQVSGAITVITDLTQQKQAEKQAFAFALEKERVNILANFIQDASHEFRTPLSVIQSSLYILGKSTSPEKRQEKTIAIENQIERLTQLLDSLVLMSKLDSGITFEFHQEDLLILLRNKLSELQPDILEKNLSVTIEATDNQIISVDIEYMQEAIKRVLHNAVRYTPTDGQIVVRFNVKEGVVILDIENSGDRIPDEILPHIFERFYRHDEAHTTPGIGLGLSIARSVIERHGGSIKAENLPNRGCRFRIILPINGVVE